MFKFTCIEYIQVERSDMWAGMGASMLQPHAPSIMGDTSLVGYGILQYSSTTHMLCTKSRVTKGGHARGSSMVEDNQQ